MISPVDKDLTPQDDTSALNQLITNSYDPNDKTESNGGVITTAQVSNGAFLHYTIRFQNTGNDTAFKIKVRDTLESRLDVGTLEMVAASHSFQLTIEKGRFLTWEFNNIRLPDSATKEPQSHGYITYRIRPKNTVNVGDTIHNTAGIYFDFNPAVGTNDSRTIVRKAANVPSTAMPVILTYPNPTHSQLTVQLPGDLKGTFDVQVLDMKGCLMMSKHVEKGDNNELKIPVAVGWMPKGRYLVRIVGDKKVYIQSILVL